jgi:hypothetical protein
MPIHPTCQRSPRKLAFPGPFAAKSQEGGTCQCRGARYHEAGAADKVSAIRNRISGGSSMVITAAHIQPIVALIAGVLILIMPRFLNLVVAIYLIFIGLSGLGVFKMLHF